jgi:hypothetical protein
MLPLSPRQNATSAAALLEEFGPHELEADASRLSAKVPLEQAPSVIDELPVAVAAYALGITSRAGTSSAIAVTAATAHAATTTVLMIIFVLIFCLFFTVAVLEEL